MSKIPHQSTLVKAYESPRLISMSPLTALLNPTLAAGMPKQVPKILLSNQCCRINKLENISQRQESKASQSRIIAIKARSSM